jgi:hypothetical protein
VIRETFAGVFCGKYNSSLLSGRVDLLEEILIARIIICSGQQQKA